MARLIDADKLPKYTGYALSASEVAIAVENAPTVDAVPVVRCKDCKYCRRVDEFEYWCEGFCSPARLVRKDDFCSHGNLND